MKNILVCFLIGLYFMSCGTPCKEGLNLLPMYGNEKKCDEQLETDKQFIQACEEQYGNTKDACIAMLRFGWKHYADGDLDTAMKRFNQAWLLDSLNAEVYMGFGSVLSDQGSFEQSLIYYDKSLKLNPENSEVWKLSGLSYGNIFYQTKDEGYLKKSIEQLKKSVSINPSNASAYALLTSAYTYYNQKDSAKKYLQITDKLNQDLIKKDVRDMIGQK